MRVFVLDGLVGFMWGFWWLGWFVVVGVFVGCLVEFGVILVE